MNALITEHDLRAAIAECQGERNPNANTCIKLAAYYTILREQQGDYSFQAPTLVENQNELIDYQSDTDFGKAVRGKDTAFILGLIDDLMTILQAVQPQLYNGVMRELNK